MKVTRILSITAIAAFMAASPCFAQLGGFQAGIATPTFGFPPTQAPATVRGGTFTGIGGFVVPAPVIAPVPVQPFFVPQQPFFIPNQLLMPPVQPFPIQNPVIIPNQVLLPGQTFIPQPVLTPPAIIHAPIPIHPRAHVRQPVPVIGTPLAQLIRQFGHPTVSIITNRGEVLQFSGGVTVTIQNGKVAGPR